MFTQTTQKPLTQRADEVRLGWVWSVDHKCGFLYAAGSCPPWMFTSGSTIPKRQPSRSRIETQALRDNKEGSG